MRGGRRHGGRRHGGRRDGIPGRLVGGGGVFGCGAGGGVPDGTALVRHGGRAGDLLGGGRPSSVSPLLPLRILRVQQPHRVPPELGDEGAREPRVEGAAVQDGVVGAGAFQDAVEGRPCGGVLAQARADQVGDALGDALQVRFLLGDAEHQRVHTAAARGAEGQGAGGGVGEDRAEAEDVARRGDAVAPHLLGRHETGRPDERPGAGEPAVGHGLQGPRDAEVDDARAVDGDQHVGRLQVAVDDAGGVDVLERVRESGREDADGSLGQGPVVVPDDLLQARPGDVPRGHPRHRRLGVRVQHRRRPVPADPPRGPHLLPEPLPELLLRGQLLAHEFHGDRTAPLRAGQVDVPHAPRAEPRQQPVRTDVLRIPGPQLLHRSAAFPPHVSNRSRIVRGPGGVTWAMSTVM